MGRPYFIAGDFTLTRGTDQIRMCSRRNLCLLLLQSGLDSIVHYSITTIGNYRTVKL